ncbi:MAG: hypothetical protein VCF07_05715, partial [Nitrospinota bacterium]
LSWLIGPLLTVFFIGGSLVLGLMTSPDRLIGAKEPPLEFQQPSGLCRGNGMKRLFVSALVLGGVLLFGMQEAQAKRHKLTKTSIKATYKRLLKKCGRKSTRDPRACKKKANNFYRKQLSTLRRRIAKARRSRKRKVFSKSRLGRALNKYNRYRSQKEARACQISTKKKFTKEKARKKALAAKDRAAKNRAIAKARAAAARSRALLTGGRRGRPTAKERATAARRARNAAIAAARRSCTRIRSASAKGRCISVVSAAIPIARKYCARIRDPRENKACINGRIRGARARFDKKHAGKARAARAAKARAGRVRAAAARFRGNPRAARDIIDPVFYLSKYPDLRRALGSDHVRATQHWLSFGIKEGRQSNRNFRVKAYLNGYPDLKRAFGTNYAAALNHWNSYGRRERRNAGP